MSLNIIFAGTPEFAAHHLQALINSEHRVVAVYTQPDRPANRGKKMQPSAVKMCAQAHDLPVYQPLNFKDDANVQTLKDLNADVMVVVAYGLLLPQAVLDAPHKGCLNVHASLLPRWRGAAPIQRAIEHGDATTGITIMQMDAGLDTGDILHKVTTPIDNDDTGASLHDRLLSLGAPALLETLEHVEQDSLSPETQDDTCATYAHKLSKQEARLNWQSPAAQLALQVRAFNPFPVAHTEYQNQRVRVWQAQALNRSHQAPTGQIIAVSQDGLDVATQDGVLRITHLQMPGKKALAVSDVLNGQPDLFQIGHVFAC